MKTPTLYVTPGSHPSMAARLMLEHKGMPYKRRDLVAVVHKAVLRALGFEAATVPALKLDGRRIQGTRNIAQALDELRPEPALLPADPESRAAVDDAERWADEVLQPVPRRLAWWAMKRDRSGVRSFLEGARLGIPTGLAVATAAPIISTAAKLNDASDDSSIADLRGLRGHLDRVDELIAEGVIGGKAPSVADFQIATSVRLLLCFEDLRPLFEGRPAEDHAMRLCPDFPGRIGQVLRPDERAAVGL